MSKYSIVITEPAESDLIQITSYIAKELKEPELAGKLIDRIGNTILSLEEMPFRNNLVIDDRLSSQGVRKILVDNYIVFYIVSEESKIVTIVRILYSRRDWMSLI